MSKKLVTLKSSDKEEFVVEESIAVKSETIKNIIEDCGLDSISLPNVDGKTLAKVIQYCKKHTTTTTTTTTSNSNDGDESSSGDLDKFDDEFLDVELQILFDLVLAVNYLNIKELLDKICTKVANMIKDKKVEEVREIFNIENDFTPEEEKAIRAEHAWAHE